TRRRTAGAAPGPRGHRRVSGARRGVLHLKATCWPGLTWPRVSREVAQAIQDTQAWRDELTELRRRVALAFASLGLSHHCPEPQARGGDPRLPTRADHLTSSQEERNTAN